MPTKYIFVTGGVVSSIGKGICVASIGRILKSQGLSVTVLKLDPYLNVDPGTMSPYQHGEVFVTKDGGETDLDLGHYERFIDIELTRDSNVTAGQAYLELITRERRYDPDGAPPDERDQGPVDQPGGEVQLGRRGGGSGRHGGRH